MGNFPIWKMKVLLCERTFSGHREIYMENLSKIPDIEFFCYAPSNVGVEEDHYIFYDSAQHPKTMKTYWQWMNQIATICETKDIDIVHILDGDSIMRFFAIGFSKLNKRKIVITYHHYFDGFLRKISYKRMSNRKNTVCVVHTKSVQDALIQDGLKQVALCEYPAFNFYRLENMDKIQSKKKWGLPLDRMTIGIVGGLNSYKNILDYLQIMNQCQKKFHLLICGKEGDVCAEDINKKIEQYKDNVTLKAEKLTEEEYESAIVASDIIYCIYGKAFDGASGPLTDGVCAKKMILACEHGSLGRIVTDKHIGMVAAYDNEKQILKITEDALETNFIYDEVANNYRWELTPECFQEHYKEIYEKLLQR